MADVKPAISVEEAKILQSFRTYGVKANEMLFFNGSAGKGQSPAFGRAMQAMVDRGLVLRDHRHREAYSLSDSGYRASLAIGKQRPKTPKAIA